MIGKGSSWPRGRRCCHWCRGVEAEMAAMAQAAHTARHFNDVQSLRCTLASVFQQCPNSHITKNTSVAVWISPFRWACSRPLWGLQVLLCSGAYTSITISKTSPMTRKDVTSECETPVFISPHLQHDLYLKHFPVIASSCS